MNANNATLEQFAPDIFQFYHRALEIIQTSGTPFLLGGAYALGYYTGISRHTKDLDLFVRPADVGRTLDVFRRAGYRAEVVFSHWLAKVYYGDDFIDIISNSGNGLCTVDDAWFQHAVAGEVLRTKVSVIPVEEMIWQKAFIMERERFDGADVNHLLRARGREIDWDRLLMRFGPHWRILFTHLVLFSYVYPEDQESIPSWVLRSLIVRFHHEPPGPLNGRLCQGTLLSRTQYLPDIEEWGYTDPRQSPLGTMTKEQVVQWTDAGR